MEGKAFAKMIQGNHLCRAENSENSFYNVLTM